MKQYKTGLSYYKVWLHILTLYHSAFDLNISANLQENFGNCMSYKQSQVIKAVMKASGK